MGGEANNLQPQRWDKKLSEGDGGTSFTINTAWHSNMTIYTAAIGMMVGEYFTQPVCFQSGEMLANKAAKFNMNK